MQWTDATLLLAGVLAWAGVAVVALVAVQWDALWGFFPVLAAAIAAWAIGEYVVSRRTQSGVSGRPDREAR